MHIPRRKPELVEKEPRFTRRVTRAMARNQTQAKIGDQTGDLNNRDCRQNVRMMVPFEISIASRILHGIAVMKLRTCSRKAPWGSKNEDLDIVNKLPFKGAYVNKKGLLAFRLNSYALQKALRSSLAT